MLFPWMPRACHYAWPLLLCSSGHWSHYISLISPKIHYRVSLTYKSYPKTNLALRMYLSISYAVTIICAGTFFWKYRRFAPVWTSSIQGFTSPGLCMWTSFEWSRMWSTTSFRRSRNWSLRIESFSPSRGHLRIGQSKWSSLWADW